MSIIERIVWFAFGCTFIAAVFMAGSFAYIAHCERQFGSRSSWKHGPFRYAVWLFLLATGLAINTGVRIVDGFNQQNIAGSSPVALLAGVGLMGLAAAGFHWTATGSGKRIWWKLYLVVTAMWIMVVSWPMIP